MDKNAYLKKRNIVINLLLAIIAILFFLTSTLFYSYNKYIFFIDQIIENKDNKHLTILIFFIILLFLFLFFIFYFIFFILKTRKKAISFMDEIDNEEEIDNNENKNEQIENIKLNEMKSKVDQIPYDFENNENQIEQLLSENIINKQEFKTYLKPGQKIPEGWYFDETSGRITNIKTKELAKSFVIELENKDLIKQEKTEN